MTTEERLAKVERELAETKAQAERAKRRTRAGLAGIGLIATVSVLGLIGAHGCEPGEGGGAAVNEVRARRLVLVDDENWPRAALEMDHMEGGPVLLLYRGRMGKPCVRLGLRVDGSQLLLFDENGEPRAELAVGEEGPALTLSDAAGKPRVCLDLVEDGARLSLFDADGKLIWSAP